MIVERILTLNEIGFIVFTCSVFLSFYIPLFLGKTAQCKRFDSAASTDVAKNPTDWERLVVWHRVVYRRNAKYLAVSIIRLILLGNLFDVLISLNVGSRWSSTELGTIEL